MLPNAALYHLVAKSRPDVKPFIALIEETKIKSLSLSPIDIVTLAGPPLLPPCKYISFAIAPGSPSFAWALS